MKDNELKMGNNELKMGDDELRMGISKCVLVNFGGWALFFLKLVTYLVTMLYFAVIFTSLMIALEYILSIQQWPDWANWSIMVVGIGLPLIILYPLHFFWKGPPFMVYIWGCLISMMFVITVGGFISVSVYQDSIRKELQTGFNMTLITTTPLSVPMEWTQKRFRCCGVNNYTDWVQLSPARVIPESCCMDKNRCVTANYKHVYQKGCYEALMAYIGTHSTYIIVMITLSLILPAFSSILVCLLGAKMEAAALRPREIIIA